MVCSESAQTKNVMETANPRGGGGGGGGGVASHPIQPLGHKFYNQV